MSRFIKKDLLKEVTEEMARELKARPNLSPTYVYFIQQGEGGPIKIGTAMSPLARMAELQTGSAFELKLLGAVKGSQREERALHEIFAGFRMKGEWFRPASELVKEIGGILTNQNAFNMEHPKAGEMAAQDIRSEIQEISALDSDQIIKHILSQGGVSELTPQALSEIIHRANRGAATEIERLIFIYLRYQVMPDFLHRWPKAKAILTERMSGKRVVVKETAIRCGVSSATVHTQMKRFLTFGALYIQEAAEAYVWSRRNAIQANGAMLG